MRKLLVLLAALLLVAMTTACAPAAADQGQNDAGDIAQDILEDALFSDDEIDMVNGDNTEGYINGEKVDADMADELQQEFASAGGPAAGLPDGFPASMPLYKGAVILEGEPYGDNGFTLVYQVAAGYQDVLNFYMQVIPGLDESGIGEDEAYFEGIDIDGGNVHIDGLTVSGFHDATQVFITLKNFGG
jgi:hypothetical protein